MMKKNDVKKSGTKSPAVKKSAPKVVAKTAAAKTASKTVPTKKAAAAKPAVKAAPVKKAVAVKKPAVKAAPAKKAVAAKKPAVKAAPVKKAVAAKPAAKAAPAKKAVAAAPVAHVVVGKKVIRKKRKMTKTQKKKFIDLLMAERSEFLAQLQFHSDDALSSKKDSAGERAGMATHMADLGSDNFRHDLELGLLSDEGDVIEMIDEALSRIKSDEFGICLDCGCEIAEGRLEAKPYARYCTACKSRREKMEDPSRRKR